MKKYKYYLDFDGCLTHSLEAMVRLLNDKYNMNVPILNNQTLNVLSRKIGAYIGIILNEK